MGLSNSIDNKAWIDYHKHNFDISSIDSTINYITKNHPYNGRCEENHTTASRTDSMEELSKGADAVVIACCDSAGNEGLGELDDYTGDLDITSIGNISYIALNHSKMSVREAYKECFEKWKHSNIR